MEARKILFRGKRTDNDEWVYGNFVYDDHYNLSTTSAFISNKPENYYIFQNIPRLKGETNLLDFTVKKETVSQWTGMFDDSNPQEKIFEGDILLVDDGEDSKLFNVIFNRGCFMATPLYSKHKNNELPLYMFFALNYGKKIIVIDDVYSWNDRLRKLRKDIDNALGEENEKYTSSSYLAIVDGVTMEFPTLDEYIEFLKEKEQ